MTRHALAFALTTLAAAALVAAQAPAAAPAAAAPAPAAPTGLALPKLAYPLETLEPAISARTVDVHYNTHVKAYNTKLNAALQSNPSLQGQSLATLVTNGTADTALPPAARKALRDQGGGFANHLIYFGTLTTPNTSAPSPALASRLETAFGSVDGFKKNISAAATGVFGSGWAWLVAQPNGTLTIETTPNQDSPLMAGLGYSGGVPIFGIDVWEHAYYLDRQAARADYVAALLTAVDWAAVERNLAAAEAGDVTGVLYGTSGKGAAAPAPAPAVEGAPAGAPAPAGP